MTLLAKVQVGLSGWAGGPGVNTLYFSAGTGLSWDLVKIDGMVEEVHTAFAAFQNIYAGSLRLEVNPEVAMIESATGQLQDIYTASTVPAAIETQASRYTAPTAIAQLVRFNTDRFINGRRLKGRLFLSPLARTYASDAGTFTTEQLDIISGAFYAMSSGVGPRLAVYHRPSVKGASDGDWGDVVSVAALAKPAVLRSRRD